MKNLFPLFLLFFCFHLHGSNEVQDSIFKVKQSLSDSSPVDPLALQTIPLSPQSAIYQKYLNHQIKEYTGTPEIKIPLYEIETKGMKIPVVLSYHASGIKAHQYDGDVGAGWSLNVGGFKVMRSVFGEVDERVSVYRYSHNNWISNYANISELSLAEQRVEKDYYLQRFVLGAQDGEYDHFSYILPSSSGNFIILDSDNPDKVRALIGENKRDKITFSDGNGAYSFRNITITDEQGYIYQMSKEQKEATSPPNDIVIGWPLARILSPYNEEITFEYLEYGTMYNYPLTTHFSYTEAPFYTNWIPQDHISSPPELTGDSFSFPFSSMGSQPSLLVHKISTPHCRIMFLRRGAPFSSGEATELRYRWHQLLTDIEIYNNSDELIKKIHFDYELSTENGLCRHNLLKAVIVRGAQAFPEEKYDFSYYPPGSSLLVTNEWGYGGKDTWFHDLFRTYPSLLYKKTISGIDEYTQFESAVGVSYARYFGNRSADTNPTTNEYSLRKIVFPTGGFTEYEYEPHEDAGGGKVGGLRIKRITSKISESSSPIITEYQYEEAEVEAHLAAMDFGEELYNLTFFDQSQVGIPGLGNIAYRGTRTLILSTYPIQGELLNSTVKYGKVTIMQYDEGQNKYNGKTVMKFGHIPYFERREIPQRARFTPFSEDGSINLRMPNNTFGRGFWVNSYLGYEPVLTNRTYYDQHGIIKREENYTYSNVNKGTFNELKVKNRINVNNNTNLNQIDVYKFISTRFDYIDYDLHLGFYRLEEKRILDYVNSGLVTAVESYSYNQHNQLKEKRTYPVVEKYNYPEDFSDKVYNDMVTANILSPIIEKIKSNLRYSQTEIGSTKTNYLRFNNMYLPSSTESKILGDYQTDITFDLYDAQGNLLQYTTADGISTVLLWSYKGQYPIAEIKNATYNEVTKIISASILNAISSCLVPSDSDWRVIDNLRSNPTMVNAAVTTYTYKPLVGMLTTTDPAGVTIYYEYDSLGRLVCTKDDAGKVIEEYQYYYAK